MCLCLCCQISYSCIDFTSALYCNSPVAKKRRELFANTTKCSLSFMKSSSPSGCFENVSTDRPNSNEISRIKTTCRKVRKVQGGQGCLACPGLLRTLSGTPVRVHCGNFLVVFFFFSSTVQVHRRWMSSQEVFSHPFSYENEVDTRLFQNADLNILWISSDFA